MLLPYMTDVDPAVYAAGFTLTPYSDRWMRVAPLDVAVLHAGSPWGPVLLASAWQWPGFTLIGQPPRALWLVRAPLAVVRRRLVTPQVPVEWRPPSAGGRLA